MQAEDSKINGFLDGIEVPKLSDFFEIILNWPLQTQVGFTLGFVIWIGGSSLVLRYSRKRSGVKHPEELSIKDLKVDLGLNLREVCLFVLCGLVGIGFLAWGFSVQ